MKHDVESPEVSIIVLTYFHEAYIEKALDSVLSQECDFDFEVVVTDDNSGDGTVKTVERFMDKKDLNIKLVKHEANVGTCRNLYDGLIKCNGKYIVIMAGDDCFIDKRKIKNQKDFLDNNSDFMAICTPIKHIYSDGEDTGMVYPDRKYWGREITRDLFLNGVNYPDQGIMFRNVLTTPSARAQFEKMYIFSKYIEDLTLNFFMYDFGKVYLSEDVTYALTRRRESEEGQHNYNSIRSIKQKITDHLELLNNINEYYGGKDNLQKRYEPFVIRIISLIVKKRDFSCIKLFRMIPKKYIFKSVGNFLGRKRP